MEPTNLTVTSVQTNKQMKNRSGVSKRNRWERNLPLLLMFIPGLIFFLFFKYVPMYGLLIAFKNYNFSLGILHSPWVGMKNFQMLFQNPGNVKIIWNTLIIGLLSIVVAFPFPIVLAILLNEMKAMFFKRTIQTLVYLPHFFPGSSSAEWWSRFSLRNQA
jgi:putative aldouronate transport system permease protein